MIEDRLEDELEPDDPKEGNLSGASSGRFPRRVAPETAERTTGGNGRGVVSGGEALGEEPLRAEDLSEVGGDLLSRDEEPMSESLASAGAFGDDGAGPPPGEPSDALPEVASPDESSLEEGDDTDQGPEGDESEQDSEPDSELGPEGSSDEMPLEEIKKALEAVLFSTGDPLPVRTLGDLFGVSVHDVREAARELQFDYADTGRAFQIEDVAGGLQILTLPAYESWIRRLRQKESRTKLSPAAFEALAVIAYKQPITKADLEAIRGVQCGPVLKNLLDRGAHQGRWPRRQPRSPAPLRNDAQVPRELRHLQHP